MVHLGMYCGSNKGLAYSSRDMAKVSRMEREMHHYRNFIRSDLCRDARVPLLVR